MPLLKSVGVLSIIYFVLAIQEENNSTDIIVFPDKDVGDRNIIKVPLKPCPGGQQRIGGICRLVFSNPGRSVLISSEAKSSSRSSSSSSKSSSSSSKTSTSSSKSKPSHTAKHSGTDHSKKPHHESSHKSDNHDRSKTSHGHEPKHEDKSKKSEHKHKQKQGGRGKVTTTVETNTNKKGEHKKKQRHEGRRTTTTTTTTTRRPNRITTPMPVVMHRKNEGNPNVTNNGTGVGAIIVAPYKSCPEGQRRAPDGECKNIFR